MEDSLSIVFAILLSMILMFIFPLIDVWNLQDNLSFVLAYSATVDFVDTARNTGYIGYDLYDDFQRKLAATGNTYNITMEHRKFNEDLGNYLNTYTYEILDNINKKKVHRLDKYDYFYVTVKNTNKTQATVVSEFLAGGADTTTKIAVAYGGIVWSGRDEY